MVFVVVIIIVPEAMCHLGFKKSDCPLRKFQKGQEIESPLISLRGGR
jgi:hypothetical protein